MLTETQKQKLRDNGYELGSFNVDRETGEHTSENWLKATPLDEKRVFDLYESIIVWKSKDTGYLHFTATLEIGANLIEQSHDYTNNLNAALMCAKRIRVTNDAQIRRCDRLHCFLCGETNGKWGMVTTNYTGELRFCDNCQEKVYRKAQLLTNSMNFSGQQVKDYFSRLYFGEKSFLFIDADTREKRARAVKALESFLDGLYEFSNMGRHGGEMVAIVEKARHLILENLEAEGWEIRIPKNNYKVKMPKA